MASYIDNAGQRQEVDLKGTFFHKMASENKLSFRQQINRLHPTRPGDADAFSQMCINAGLRFKADDDHGIPAVSMKDMLDPGTEFLAATTNQTGGTYTSSPQVPDSTILFPAALLEAVNAALDVNRADAVKAFDSLVGYSKTIASNRYERPYITYNGKMGPEDSQFQRIGQNMRPPMMLSITASDVTKTIPTTSIGMEISQEALAETSLDLVALTMTKFMQYADYNEWIAQLLLVVAGDDDSVTTPAATGSDALVAVKVDTLDSAIVAAGGITQEAWLKFQMANSMTMRKTHAILDEDGLLALENRTGRPTNVMNNSQDRIDTPFEVIYPKLNDKIGLVVMPSDAGWTANLIVALDQAYALQKITSSSIAYSAVEDIVMKKTREFRFDRGFVVERLFTDAFKALSLTLTS